MTEQHDPALAVERLERALERIATLAAKAGSPVVAPPDALPAQVAASGVDADVHELAERLDRVIAQLRAALGTPAGP